MAAELCRCGHTHVDAVGETMLSQEACWDTRRQCLLLGCPCLHHVPQTITWPKPRERKPQGMRA